MARLLTVISTFVICTLVFLLDVSVVSAQTPVPSGDIDPAVWETTTNSWVGGNPNGYTEADTSAMAVRIKTNTTASQSLSVCIEVLQISSGSYGFTEFLPWNTTVAPTNLFGNGGAVGPAINIVSSAGGGNFQGHNIIIDSVTAPVLGGGSCDANYLGVAVVFHKVVGSEDGFILYGGHFARAGDPLPAGAPDATVPDGQSAAFIDGVFQSRIEGGGDKTINFKGDLIALVPGILLEKTVTTADGTCAGNTQDTISVPLGSSVKFCFVITNTGETVLEDVTLVDNDLGLDLTGDLVGLTNGDLAVGASATAEVVVQVNQTIQNTATASGSGIEDTDVGTASVYFCGDGTTNPGEQCDDGNTANGDGCTSACQCGVCGCGFAETDTDGDGTADCIDNCPNDPLKTAPGICGCGVADTDTDGDGTADCLDACPNDPLKTTPGQCGCGVPDTDTDGDGIPDCNDVCPNEPNTDTDQDGTLDCLEECDTDPNKTAPGVCGCNVADTDTDGDGVADCIDLCPSDPLKSDPGVCGCGVADVDTDGDRTLDCLDNCPSDPNKIDPGVCGCGVSDVDTDLDQTPDCIDNCPNDPNKTQPGQCGCGVLDLDTDGDGTLDCLDLCPADEEKTTPGFCGCGVPDTDTDGDGTADCLDQCPNDPLKSAPGICGCGEADADSDGDGTADCNDGCPQDPDKTSAGICGCGVADTDTDGDGNADCNDPCPTDPNKGGFTNGNLSEQEFLVIDVTGPGICGCGVPDTDSDGDGVADCLDNCDSDPNKTEPGTCGCGVDDVDSDEDGTPDCNDQCINDSSKTAPGVCGCGVADTDTDGDGSADCIDQCPSDSGKTSPGLCGCGAADTDTDNDGTPNCNDSCPTDSGKTSAGVCGCGVPDVDSDGDGVLDCLDLNCNEVNISATQFALDGSSFEQRAVVRDATRGITKFGRAADKAFAKDLLKQAEELYLQNWTLVWALPAVQTQCANADFCVNVDQSSTVTQYDANAVELDKLVQQAVKRLRRVTGQKGTGFLNRSKKELQKNLALSATLPTFTSACVSPSVG